MKFVHKEDLLSTAWNGVVSTDDVERLSEIDVVFCEHCKYSCRAYGLLHCRLHKAAAGYWAPVANDFFCGDGEEKRV